MESLVKSPGSRGEVQRRPHRDNIQSSFDLLAELAKFNYPAVRFLDSVLVGRGREAPLGKAFLDVVGQNLVDSNMFIRAMVVSSAKDDGGGGGLDGGKKKSELFRFFGDFDIQVFYTTKLLSLVSVDNLTQENVSCLNTSLASINDVPAVTWPPVLLPSIPTHTHKKKNGIVTVRMQIILMLCRRRGKLGSALAAMEARAEGRDAMKNLRRLLLFW